MNFDPFDDYGDTESWDALEEASLIASHVDVLRGSSGIFELVPYTSFGRWCRELSAVF